MFQTLLTFYRRFFLLTGSISVIFCFFSSSSNSLSYGFTLLWMKIITNLLIGLLYIIFSTESMIFYNNLGYSSTKMYAGVMSIDILISIILIGITSLLK